MLTQSFLPLMTSDDRTLGIVPITTTTYPDVIVNQTYDTIKHYNMRGVLSKTITTTKSRIGPASSTTVGSFTTKGGSGRVITSTPRVVTTYPSDGFVDDAARANLGTQTINGVTYRLRTVNYHRLTGATWQAGSQMSYMAIDLSPTEERTLYQNNFRGLNLIAFDSRWTFAPNTAFKITYVGQLAAFLMQSAQVQFSTPTLSTPTGNNFSRNWAVNSPFTNIGSSQFIDINWMQELQINANAFAPTVATLGAASSDPGAGKSLRAFLVQAPQQMDTLMVNTTVRIVKIIQGPAAPGTYTWPLTATDSQGNSATFNFTVVVTS